MVHFTHGVSGLREWESVFQQRRVVSQHDGTEMGQWVEEIKCICQQDIG